MWKTVSAIAAAGLLAAAISLLPGFSPEVAASVPAAKSEATKTDATKSAATKSDGADLPADCARHGWPYYEPACLRGSARDAGDARPVRIVSTDRVALADPRTDRALAPLWTSVEALQTAVPVWAKAFAPDSAPGVAPVRITLALAAQ